MDIYENEGFFPDHDTVVCNRCDGVMKYMGRGIYTCVECGNEYLNNYAKVREFLEKRGPSTVMEISVGTGVSRKEVAGFLNDGKIMLSNASNVKLTCEVCGNPIRYGTVCDSCEKKLKIDKTPIDSDGRPVRSVYSASQNMLSYDGQAGMRFLKGRQRRALDQFSR